MNGSLPPEFGAARWESERKRRTLAVAALLVAVAVALPLLSLLAPPPDPIVIDGAFSDWAGVQAYPDAVDDGTPLAGVNLVGFAATSGREGLYVLVQATEGSSLFGDASNETASRRVLVLVDADRDPSTGWDALGLGVDQVVEVSGDRGAVRGASVLTYATTRADRADASGFARTGAARSAAVGNQLEVLVPSVSTAGESDDGPFLLVVAQDSSGAQDTGDMVFTTRPGAVSVEPSLGAPEVVPSDRDVLLSSFEVRAVHTDLSLATLPLRVVGTGGAVTLSHAVYGGADLPLGVSAAPGDLVVLDLSAAGAAPLAAGGGARTLEVWGRAAAGADGAALRLVAGPSAGAASTGAGDGFSGHVSVLPAATFERSYLGAAPSTIRADGAFADWSGWAPLDPDPAGDTSPRTTGPTPGGPNGGTAPVPAVDITASRAVVDGGADVASFLLSVAGSLMSSQELAAPPLVAAPSVPSSGGGGGPAAPPARGDTATLYVDTDGSPATGWTGLDGLGVDALVRVRGTGGGWGRTPTVAETSVARWDDSAGAFADVGGDVLVGFGSSRMEAQVDAALLCGGPCGPVRYAFHLASPRGASDDTAARPGASRSGGDRLLAYEAAAGVRTAFAGDMAVPLLSLSLSAPSSNTGPAHLTAVRVVLAGADPAGVPRVALYRDEPPLGLVGPEELLAGPLAAGPLSPSGRADLPLPSPLELPPGALVDFLVAIDTSDALAAPTNVSATLEGALGLATAEPFAWEASSDGAPHAVHFLPSSPGSRGQNQIVINEMNIDEGWVELYHTLGTAVSLSSPSQMGVEVWRTNPPQNKYFVEQIVLAGSTDSNGYFTLNLTIPYSGSGKTYFVSLWCNNCTAGHTANGNNTTYVDSVEIPVSAVNGMWGRYPNGNGSFTTTTNNTRGAENQIPEFGDLAVTLGMTLAAVFITRRARGRAARGGRTSSHHRSMNQ